MTITSGPSQPINLILKSRKGKIGSLSIEAVISENYSFTSTPTKFPIEDGSVVSDHIVAEPLSITIEGFISNTPVGQDPGNYAQETFNELYSMWQDKQLVDVEALYVTYKNMCITSIAIPRNAQTGQAIHFTCQLTQIKVVSNSADNADIFASAVLDQASPSKSLGQRVTSEVPSVIKNLVTAQQQNLLLYYEGN